MTDGRELPGFRKKSFALPFDGGEIRFEHLDGIYGFTGLVIEKLTGDMPIFQRPSSPSNIGFVLNETDITDEVISLIADSLLDTKKHFMRVAFALFICAIYTYINMQTVSLLSRVNIVL